MLSGCNLINPHEKVPGYISVSSVKLQLTDTTNQGQGSSSQKITDVWFDVSNTFTGAYQLPAMFPVLETGQQHLFFRAGVKVDGLSTNRAPYPFYSIYDTFVNITAAKVDTIRPHFKYANQTKFELIENFLGIVPQVDTIGGVHGAAGTVDHSYGYDGPGSYYVELKPQQSDSFFQVWNKKTLYTWQPGQIVWMELNYQTDIPIDFGLYAVSSTQQAYDIPVSGVNPSANWNKVYVNLSDVIAQNGIMLGYKVYISGSLKGRSSAHVHLDNIKILSLP